MFTEAKQGTAWGLVRFLFGYLSANLQTAMEYRTSFLMSVFAMVLNDGIWLVFWILYFQRFPVVRGWTQIDVMMLWAVVPTAFGLAHGLLGNSLQVARLIALGQLDYYLALPKPVLLHILVSRLAIANLGDMLFGPAVYLLFGQPTWERTLLFVASSTLAAAILLGFAVAVQSAAFFLGNAQELGTQAQMGMIHFSTYPSPIYSGWVRVALYTVVPAGFINAIPVRVMQRFEPGFFLELAGMATVVLGLGIWLFAVGLRRYESGNLAGMRS